MVVEYAIVCQHLTKKFGNFTAVSDFNIKVRKREQFSVS